MSKKLIFTALVAMLMLAAGVTAPQHSVDARVGESWEIVSRLSTGCESGETGFVVDFKNLTSGDTYYVDTIVRDHGGVIYMDEYLSTVAPGFLDNDWFVFNVNDRGLATGDWPLPADSILTIEVKLLDASEQVLSIDTYQFTCNADDLYDISTPGCDQYLNIPSNAVVGEFVTDAPVYWKPGESAKPPVTIEAGNTAWVLGTDASGAYYKIIWVCDQVYVPVNSMGPNNDAVWNGTPLPTTNAN